MLVYDLGNLINKQMGEISWITLTTDRSKTYVVNELCGDVFC